MSNSMLEIVPYLCSSIFSSDGSMMELPSQRLRFSYLSCKIASYIIPDLTMISCVKYKAAQLQLPSDSLITHANAIEEDPSRI